MNFTTMSEAIAAYDEMLDETMDIGDAGQFATAFEILRACDPIAYRVGFHDWLDGEGIDIDSLEEDADLP